MKESRYKNLKGHKGIRLDTSTKHYLATKYIGQKAFSKSFINLKEAMNWRANFHPSLPDVPEKKTENSMLANFTQRQSFKLNGEDFGYTFADAWDLYTKIYLPTLEKHSQDHRLAKENFLLPLMKFKMVEINAFLLDRFMADHKTLAIKNKSKRFNFNDDLKALKAILNWYRENYDPLFVNPVLPRHRNAGLIKKIPQKNKKLRPEELISFFQELSPFWRDFAETQFYLGARVSEIAGLQASSINLEEKEICIQHVAIWNYKTKLFDYLKDCPKNGEISYASINQKLEEILRRRLAIAKKGFVFHEDGKPLNYRCIQYNYNKALEKAGLADKFSSTHIMRHSMGTITRKVTGSLDSAQAVTRHKDNKVAQQYASLPTEANRKAVNDVGDFLDNLEHGNVKTNSRFKLSLIKDGSNEGDIPEQT